MGLDHGEAIGFHVPHVIDHDMIVVVKGQDYTVRKEIFKLLEYFVRMIRVG